MTVITLRKISKYTSRGISPRYVNTDGLLVINQKCIRDQKINLGPARLTDRNKKFGLDKKVQKFDILINSTGVGTLGRVAQLKNSLDATVDSHVTIFRPADFIEGQNKKIDPLYIGYCVRNQEKFIESKGVGATGQTELSKDSILDEVLILLPEYKSQSRIASVLSAYDDLIENNEKRIKTLEEMAQLLYSEWFVKPMKKWKITELGKKIKIKKGKNITKKTITHGNVPVVAGGLDPAYYHNEANTFAPVITISASGANSGFVNLYYENVWASDCSFVDKNITSYPYFYYLFLKNNQTEITKSQRGSAQPHVYPADLMRLKVADISEDYLKKFETKAEVIFNDIKNIKQRNDNLLKTRDLLIPQLVTGKRELK